MITRIPTEDEIARAYAYVEGQYHLDGRISHEQWSEGLAFTHATNRIEPDDRFRAREMRDQCDERTLRCMTARADYLRASEGHHDSHEERFSTAPRYRVTQ